MLYIHQNGKTIGPHDEAFVTEGLKSGQLSPSAMACIVGESAWRPIGEVISIPKDFIPPPPPLGVPTSGIGFRKEAGVVLGKVAGRITSVAGVDKIEGLSGKDFFSTVLKKRGDDEVEALFITGTKETTPPLSEVDPHWPKPWLFFKMLLGSLVLFLGLAYGVYHLECINLYPGLIMIGAFAIPFSVLIFCVEMNVLRNVSFYQVLKLLLMGSIASILLTLTLSSIFPVDSWFGYVGTGIVEEAGKVLAVALLMGRRRYNWILNGMLFGAAVGAGFAAFESAGYILGAGLSSDAAMIQEIIVRAILAPGGHVVWCAITSAALWKVRGNNNFSFEMLKTPQFIRAFCFVAALHAIWDIDAIRIPFLGDCGIIGKMLLLTVVAWLVALGYIQAGLRQVRQAQQVTPTPENEAPSAAKSVSA